MPPSSAAAAAGDAGASPSPARGAKGGSTGVAGSNAAAKARAMAVENLWFNHKFITLRSYRGEYLAIRDVDGVAEVTIAGCEGTPLRAQCYSQGKHYSSSSRGGPIVYGAGVYLEVPGKRYLKVKGPQPDSPLDMTVSDDAQGRATRWTIVSVDIGPWNAPQHSEDGPARQVQLHDVVALRAEDGRFLTDSDGAPVASNERGEAQCFSISRPGVPYVPAWNRAAGSSLSFVATPAPAEQLRLGNRAQQEAALVEDLLFALLGRDGELIVDVNAGSDSPLEPPEFTLRPGLALDPTLASAAQYVLPLCDAYALVERFVEQGLSHAHGMVSHALAEAVALHLRDFEVLINQLENEFLAGSLSLQRLWVVVQSQQTLLNRLSRLAEAVQDPQRRAELSGSAEAEAEAAALGPHADEVSQEMRLSNLTASFMSAGGSATLKPGRFRRTYSTLALPARASLQRSVASAKKKREALRGGALLNVVYGLVVTEGDRAARELYTELLAKACAPYFEMLEAWVYRGYVMDQYVEFMIKESRSVRKERDTLDAYWDKRYSVNWDQAPAFFPKDLVVKILTAGKYLNVVREDGRPLAFAGMRTLQYAAESREYQEVIHEAYNFSTRALLDVLMTEQKLMARLKSIKRYFLLDQGDLFVHFIDSAEAELMKPVSQILPPKIASLMELAVNTSSASQDPFHENLSATIDSHDLMDRVAAIKHLLQGDGSAGSGGGAGGSGSGVGGKKGPRARGQPASKLKAARASAAAAQQANRTPLRGLHCLVLKYKVRWPLTLIFTTTALNQYSWLFSHLFYLKCLEWQLGRIWTTQMEMKDMNPSLIARLRPILHLRQCMLHFLQQVLFYMLVEVIEPYWHELELKIRVAHSVDEVIQFHTQFLKDCLRECLLTDPDVLRALRDVTSYVEKFIDFSAQSSSWWQGSESRGGLARSQETRSSTPSEAASKRAAGKSKKASAGDPPPLHPQISAALAASGLPTSGKRTRGEKRGSVFKVRKARLQTQSKRVEASTRLVSWMDRATFIQREFAESLKKLFAFMEKRERSGEHQHLSHLRARLDFNGFYSGVFGIKPTGRSFDERR